jgi:hypothetical protein
MLVAVVTRDGRMVGLYTSQVDAWLDAKPLGAVMWRCAPNNDQCEAIQRAMTPERQRAGGTGAARARVAARRARAWRRDALRRIAIPLYQVAKCDSFKCIIAHVTAILRVTA